MGTGKPNNGRGRPRKKEFFKRQYTVTFNEKVIYTLILSSVTIGNQYGVDRFNTKEQEEWVKAHDGETRRGILLDVYEKVPKGSMSFKEAVEGKVQLDRDGKPKIQTGNTRKLIARIKDDKEGYIFYINLWNVEFEKNYLAEIIEKMYVPYSWMVNRDKVMEKIGRTPEQIIEDCREENYKRRFEDGIERIAKRIKKSKIAYERELNIIRTAKKDYRKKIMELDRVEDIVREYWNTVPKEERTI